MESKIFTKISSKWITGIGIFLAGCSSVKTPVGPTCVSCKPYVVRGSRYHPQTFYEYDEVGFASWYGDDFHGKSKATGERFNKMAMTAAHRTLPIPSVAKVTNLRNGRSVIVIIDDRGPYCYTGRIIDLSYGAAQVLDLHKYKPSKVRVQTLVADSFKLSLYIAKHCKRRKDPLGRTWSQLYFQEILGIGPGSPVGPKRNIAFETHSKKPPQIVKPLSDNKKKKLRQPKSQQLGRFLKM
ncbi:MAG: septal ring lytic transglycosylase RlpA family protein [Holosporales bacterium]|jgi:rare lipoprotein A (peptidoglycan hydrolase)|nr:septal ring lytic transglycosylase RlpA family protein [Holosporales bacterium]